jgi:ATP-dependent Lon protease
LATGRSISGEIGMTGEISLNGKILKIGGLREKVLAAKREGLVKVIVPYANRLDIEELDDKLKQGMEFSFVSDYDEVVDILFPGKEKVQIGA